MTPGGVTVAIPVLNGGAVLGQTLAAVRGQRAETDVELLVADSGSSDGSRELAERSGARVIDVPRGRVLPRRHAQPAHARGHRSPRGLPDPGRDARGRPVAGAPARGVRAGRRRGPGVRPLRAAPGRQPDGAARAGELFGSFAGPDGRPRVDRAVGAATARGGRSSPTPTAASPAGPGSRCRSGRWPTPRTSCWRATCWRRGGPRRTSPRPGSCTRTSTGRWSGCAAPSTRRARCARCTATARYSGPGAVVAGRPAPRARRSGPAAGRGCAGGPPAGAAGRVHRRTTWRGRLVPHSGPARTGVPARAAAALVAGGPRRLRTPMLNRLLKDLPRRAALTVQTYGWLDLWRRVVTSPLRPFGLDRGLRRRLERRSEMRDAAALVPRAGRPVLVVDPHLRAARRSPSPRSRASAGRADRRTSGSWWSTTPAPRPTGARSRRSRARSWCWPARTPATPPA